MPQCGLCPPPDDRRGFRADLGTLAAERGIRKPNGGISRFPLLLFGGSRTSDYAAGRALEKLEGSATPGNRIYYMAAPPDSFPAIFTNLERSGLARTKQPGAWTRVVVEKPFGHDLASARELNALIHTCFEERQIFRIDHYLGKETVQNILVLRLANGIWPLWAASVDHTRHRGERVLEARAGYTRGPGCSGTYSRTTCPPCP